MTTAAERRTDLKFDTNEMIGWWTMLQNLVALSERVNTRRQLITRKWEKRGRERSCWTGLNSEVSGHFWLQSVPRKALWMKCYFPLYNVTLNIWHVHINMNSAVFDLWPCAAAEPLMTLQQLRLLFFQLADTVWMEQHHVWSVRSKHGQYAKDSVIRDPQCAGREVSKAVNTSEEYPSPSDSCQCTKSATVNIAAGAGFKDTFNKKFKCTQTVCRCLGNFVVLSSIFLHYTNMDPIYKEFHQHWVKRYLFEFPACADLCVWEPGSVSLRLINSDAGWQFSCSSDIFYHTCAGDWRTFKLVTFLLWKYPFSLMAAKQVCLS